ncbi:hypothetical protein FRX31_013462 [Thalictrum thalictroides]|uniref:Uncharacterized protein n=1 Tax=Thalictrum thalictroides TaxID=46969 RepID=A0A7J6WK29_THATH|nr:hypothetical protein FRX31_013462 [Thalictrum thalictroides]
MQFRVGKFPKGIVAELLAFRGENGKLNGEGMSSNIGELGMGITGKAGALAKLGNLVRLKLPRGLPLAREVMGWKNSAPLPLGR